MAVGSLLADIPSLLGVFVPANHVDVTRFFLRLGLIGNPWCFSFCLVDPLCAKDILGEAECSMMARVGFARRGSARTRPPAGQPAG
jgi:hypothetical protein